jgi:hypothetical protein
MDVRGLLGEKLPGGDHDAVTEDGWVPVTEARQNLELTRSIEEAGGDQRVTTAERGDPPWGLAHDASPSLTAA